MVYMLQMSITIFVARIAVIIVFLNIGDVCRSVCNDNTMKLTVNDKCYGWGIGEGYDDVDSDDYDDDDDHMVIWL